MTQPLSRREQKALRKAGSQGSDPAVTVNTSGVRSGLVYMVANLIAVFVFPFWMLWQGFIEWVGRRGDKTA